MTFAEIGRVIESKRRVIEMETKRRALYDYKLADLIGVSIARVHNSKNKLPSINEVYPHLFPIDEEAQQEQLDNLSAIRFTQFAQAFNDKYKKECEKQDG